jgi:hypothetical protein
MSTGKSASGAGGEFPFGSHGSNKTLLSVKLESNVTDFHKTAHHINLEQDV